MVREIVRDPMFLQRKSVDASMADMPAAIDLLDTLKANFEGCVGMAANMIGVSKRIIAVSDNGKYILMFNPEIIKGYGEYETEEGCLSLDGERKTKRFKTIKVKYTTDKFKTTTRTFTDFTSQIIQHEIDHCNGILI
jgi:peptide deformylase